MTSTLKHADSAASGNSVVAYVIDCLLNEKRYRVSTSELDSQNCRDAATVPLPFRLCMANVIISACQKIPETCKKRFAALIFPSLLHAAEVLLYF